MIAMDNKDKMNERKKVKLTKFNADSRGILIPKTFLKFLGFEDDEDLYLTSHQAIDGKRYVTCEKCEPL